MDIYKYWMQEVQFYSTTMVGNFTYLGGMKMSQLNPFYKASFDFSGTLKEEAVCCYESTDTTFGNFFNARISFQLEIKIQRNWRTEELR